MTEQTPSSNQRIVRRLNIPVLLGTILLLVILTPAIWFLHQYQLRSVREQFLVRSSAFQSEEEWDKAAESLERYLLLSPTDNDRKVELARVYDQSARSRPQIERSLTLQAIALGICEADQSKQDEIVPIRNRMIDRLMQVGRYEDALDQLAKSATSAKDSDIQKKFALCRYELAANKRTHNLPVNLQATLPEWVKGLDSTHFVDLLSKSLLDMPGDVELSLALARAYLGPSELMKGSQLAGEGAPELRSRAVSIVDRMLASHREDPAVWIAHYEIVSQIDRTAADTDIQQMLRIAGENSSVQRVAGLHLLAKAKEIRKANEEQGKTILSESEKLLRQVLDSPLGKDAKVYSRLGEILVELERSDEGLKMWQDGLRVVPPPTALLHFNIVGFLLNAKRFDEAKDALQQMDEAVQREGPLLSPYAQSSITRASKQQWASYYLARGDVKSATQLMEQVVASSRELEAVNQAEAWAFLASAYFDLEQFDRSATAFEQAIVLTPTDDRFRRGAASAWYAAQRFQESFKHLQAIDPKSLGDWAQLAECILEIQRRQRHDETLWKIFDDAIANTRRIRATYSDPNEELWLGEIVAIDTKLERAPPQQVDDTKASCAEELLKLCERFPNSDELKRRAVVQLRSWGMEPLSLNLMNELEKRVDESNGALLANAERLLQKGQTLEAKQLLEKGLKRDPENRQLRRALQSSIQPKKTVTDWKESDLAALSVPQLKGLCEMALNRPLTNNPEDLEDEIKREKLFASWDNEIARFEKQLRIVEGDTGTEWRYIRARRLLAKASIDDKLDLTEVVEIGGYLDRQRPQWSATHTLLGTIADLQKNPTEAIRAYTRAIQLGAQELRVFERLAELLYQQGMITEASALIDRLGSKTSLSRRLSSIALTLSSSREGDLLGIAKEGTELRPTDPMAWIWYSQVLESSTRGASTSERSKGIDEARNALVKAKEVARGNDLRVLNAEFGFLLATRDESKLNELIESVKNDSSFSEAEKWKTIAQFYSARGDSKNAVPAYRKAIQLNSNSGELGRRLAQTLVSLGKQDEAIQELTTLATADPKDAETRRSLATLLAARGTEKDWQAVDKLLANSALDTTLDDKRLRSELLAQKGSPGDLAQAQFIMESIVEDPNNRTDSDRFRLASLYVQNAQFLQGQSGKEKQVKQLFDSAERQLKLATENSQAPIEFLYAYADFLLDQKQTTGARSVFDRMNTQSADNFATVLMKTRLQVLEGKSEQASKTLEEWLSAKKSALPRGYTPTQMAELLSLAGQGMQMIGSSARAEELLREAYELDSRAGLNYVRSLSRSNNSTARENAIRFLMKRASENKNSESMQMLATMLSVGETNPELLENAERLLRQVNTSNDSDLNVLLSVADYWLSKNKQSDAIEIYRRVIQMRPNDVVALNNISNLLAEDPGSIEEALGYIEQALRIAGRQPLLLDTKAVLLMNSGRVEEAIPVLEMAIASSDDPRLKLHMFIALRNANRIADANRVAAAININQLKNTLLTPSDQRELNLLLEGNK